MVADSAQHGVESRSLRGDIRGDRDLKKSGDDYEGLLARRPRLLHVGSINADTADQAINEVVKLFRIEPAQRDKLTATEVQTRRERPYSR
jgi:hypothetical protein